MKEILQKAAKVKLLILDVDGVLTDGTIYIADSGSEFKGFHCRDGVGIKMLLKTGIEIAIISGRASAATKHRLLPLGVKYIYLNQGDKTLAFNELKKKLNLINEQIAYVGDDLPDLPVMQQVGLKITVADGAAIIKQHADWITAANGGHGAVREVCELIMSAI